jgi:hypothetical protein
MVGRRVLVFPSESLALASSSFPRLPRFPFLLPLFTFQWSFSSTSPYHWPLPLLPTLSSLSLLSTSLAPVLTVVSLYVYRTMLIWKQLRRRPIEGINGISKRQARS